MLSRHLLTTRVHIPRYGAEEYFKDPARLYVEKRGPLLTIPEYRELLRYGWHASFYYDLYESCKSVFLDDWEKFLETTWFGIFHRRAGGIRPDTKWDLRKDALLIARLISDGLNIHHAHESYTCRISCTALATILGYPAGLPTDVLERASEWLESLRLAEVDIDDYLQQELDIVLQRADAKRQAPRAWHCMSKETKLETLFDMLNSRQRLAANCGTTDDLLQIMPTFRWLQQALMPALGAEESSHLLWKEMMMDNITFSWPFLGNTYLFESSIRGMRNLPVQTSKALETYDVFLKLREDRFYRNQERKWEKLKKTRGIGNDAKPMPGNWELEWTEYQGSW